MRKRKTFSMITPEEVAHVAHLARLYLSEAEQEQFTEQLGAILDYMEQLNEVPTDGVEPTSHVLDLVNVFREDRVHQTITVEEALRNAPESAHQYVVVPRIVE
jgi:aspartyl-tRNA(Asn)/glutamyl-tRNA(Gln) amidotransferase subunit C